VNPIVRDRSLAMARQRCRPRSMAEWLEDHGAAIVLLNSNLGLVARTGLNWRPGGALRWKVKTIGWKGRGVVCEKLAPSMLWPPPVSVKDRWVGPREEVLNVPITC
jgi:hypothetical protein